MSVLTVVGNQVYMVKGTNKPQIMEDKMTDKDNENPLNASAEAMHRAHEIRFNQSSRMPKSQPVADKELVEKVPTHWCQVCESYLKGHDLTVGDWVSCTNPECKPGARQWKFSEYYQLTKAIPIIKEALDKEFAEEKADFGLSVHEAAWETACKVERERIKGEAFIASSLCMKCGKVHKMFMWCDGKALQEEK